VIAAVKIEQTALQKSLSEQIVLILQSVNAVAAVLIPSLMILYIQPNPGNLDQIFVIYLASGLAVMVLVSILFCKLVSYAQVNTNLRIKYTQSKKRDQEKSKETLNYPFNLTIPSKYSIFSHLPTDMYRFWCLPTLCYQLNYPKSPKVRKLFLLRRIIEASFFSFLIYVIVVQYIVPLVHNSVNSFMTNDIFRIAERLLKLAIPNLYVWLLGFYVVFHLYLNIVAEIFQYGDRLFYKDWWNSTTLGYFWRTWNLPVHNWMALHIYIPAMKRGLTKSQASFLCFFMSAIFHEVMNFWDNSVR
jgi:diacylglycerol O-acyltransferase-1